LLERERLGARQKLSETEAKLSQTIYEQTGGNQNFGLIRSKGDQALFTLSTQEMKLRWKVPPNRPLADFAPTVLITAKEFAAAITSHNARQKHMQTETEISAEHITNNKAVRQTLLGRDIIPENLPPAEDLKKVERRLKAEEKKSLPTPDRKETSEDAR